MDNIKVLKAAINTYGEKWQIDRAIEEMSELTKALLKNRRTDNKETRRDVREEIADVYVTLRQMCLIFDPDGEIPKIAEYKIERLAHRLEEQLPERNEISERTLKRITGSLKRRGVGEGTYVVRRCADDATSVVVLEDKP